MVIYKGARRAIGCVAGSVVLFASLQSISFAAAVESNFFSDTINSVSRTVNLVNDYGANGGDSGDDSAALQRAIDDMTRLSGGGKIKIPAGTFYLVGVDVKSNVHIVIDSNATLRLVPSESSATMFKIGAGQTDVTARNVSIRSSSGRFTVDFKNSTLNSRGKASAFGLNNTNNFMVSGFRILDKQSSQPGVHVVGSTYIPKNGIVKNGSIVDAGYGYGLVQSAAGDNILFKNLEGIGGTTLRFEGPDAYDIPLSRSLNNIVGENIKITNGHHGVSLIAKNSGHGRVDIDGVTAISSLRAVVAGIRTTNARYDQRSTVKNVWALYGTQAELKPKDFGAVPYQLQGSIAGSPIYSNVHRGPSIRAMKIDEGALPLGNIQNVTQSGFQYVSNALYVVPNAPTANPDYVSVTSSNTVTIRPLDNDTGRSLQLLAPSAWSLQGGSVVHSSKILFYTPKPGFNGEDKIWYTVNDSEGRGGWGEITITVSGNAAANPYPAGKSDWFNATGGASQTFDVLANDVGNGLNLVAPSAWSLQGGNVALVSNKLRYTPKPGYNGQDKIWYTFRDIENRQGWGEVTISVSGNAAANPYPVGKADWFNATGGVTQTLNALANDVGNGLVLNAPNSAYSLQGGNVWLSNNALRYTPKPGYNGQDKIWYTFRDVEGRQGWGEVTISVSGGVAASNPYPEGKPDWFNATSGVRKTLNALANDVGNGLVLNPLSSAYSLQGGNVSISNNAISYRSKSGFRGEDKIWYSFKDVEGRTAWGEVTINVQ